MSDHSISRADTAVELLELRDRLDVLDEELRARDLGFVVAPLVCTVLAVPLLTVLFIHDVAFFVAFLSAFVIGFGAVFVGMAVERRRLSGERETIGDGIRRIEERSSRESRPHTSERSQTL